jgi:hypothetical protein
MPVIPVTWQTFGTCDFMGRHTREKPTAPLLCCRHVDGWP